MFISNLLTRAESLDTLAEKIGESLLVNDNDFTRARLEVVGRQRLDAWTAYYNQLSRNESINARFDAMESDREAWEDYKNVGNYAQAMM